MVLLTEAQKDAFAHDGYLLLRGFYDARTEIEPIQRALYDIIDLLNAKHGTHVHRQDFVPKQFDSGFQRLIAIDRTIGSETYDTAKMIPAFHRLLSSEKNERLFKQVRRTDLVGIGGASFGIRIDNPLEEQFRSHWHQEFLFQPQSMDGIVFWSPLVDIEQNMGPVQICPRSHKDGLCVYRKGGRYSGKPGAYQIGLADEDATVGRYATVAPLTKPGDLLILDFLTLHQSGINVSARSRWSMQFRLFNFRDPVGSELRWKPSVTAGTDIETLFPDRFVP